MRGSWCPPWSSTVKQRIAAFLVPRKCHNEAAIHFDNDRRLGLILAAPRTSSAYAVAAARADFRGRDKRITRSALPLDRCAKTPLHGDPKAGARKRRAWSASVLVFPNKFLADFRVAKEAEPSVTSPRHLQGGDIGERSCQDLESSWPR